MAIYGVAILSLCLLAGLLIGKVLGWLLGMNANVGGVGIAMLLLVYVADRLKAAGRFTSPSEAGLLFWSSIYIPVIVAMAASVNVRGAISGGPAAIFAGSLAVVICFALVPVLSRMGRGSDDDSNFPK
jgi:malonate transporter MadL subunit